MSAPKPALPPVVSSAQWQAELEKLLHQEKALTRARDALNAKRRRLPMRHIQQPYVLQGEQGAVSLSDVFAGRRQLIVYHFMFAPDWDAGCPGCSWVVDAMTHPAHISARDTTLAIVGRASLTKLLAYRDRMQWHTPIPWYSSLDTTFNQDFGATTVDGEQHGVSVFIRDGDQIYQTYHSGDRGVEYLGTQWSYLDLTPYGRQEIWEDSPNGWPQSAPYAWNRRHDEYDESDT